MTENREFTYPSSADGCRLHAREWLPEGQPRAVLQIVHGVSEHMGRYAPLAAFLAEHGIVTVGADQLGHGCSAGGKPGHFADRNGWAHAVADIHALRRRMGEAYPDLPYFILGHSMGSFLLRTYLIDYPEDGLAGAILSGTGQESAAVVGGGRVLAAMIARLRGGEKPSKLLHQLSLGSYNKQFEPARTPADWISRDEGMVDAYLADPYCRYRAGAALMRDMMGGLRYIAKRKNIGKMNRDLPILFFSGDRDPVGGNGAGVRRVCGWFREAGCRDVTLTLYPEGRHEMLNEVNRAEVCADLLQWMEERVEPHELHS